MVDESFDLGVDTEEEETSLAQDIAALINEHSMENRSNTPDFILAAFLTACLLSWNRATRDRDRWWGVKHKIGGTV